MTRRALLIGSPIVVSGMITSAVVIPAMTHEEYTPTPTSTPRSSTSKTAAAPTMSAPTTQMTDPNAPGFDWARVHVRALAGVSNEQANTDLASCRAANTWTDRIVFCLTATGRWEFFDPSTGRNWR